MSTKRKKAQGTAGQGVRFVDSLVGDHNCTFTRVPQEDDFGIDGYIEFVQAEEATGCCIAVQIKSGVSYRSRTGTVYSFSSDRAHFEYWSSHSLPVAAVIYDPAKKAAVWGDITSHLEQWPERIASGPYTITATHEFSEATFADFRDYWLAYRDRYAHDASFGRALENLAQMHDLDASMSGLLSLFSFHRSRPASWHYLISSIRLLRGHPLLERLIVTLGYLPGHGDILWHPGNYVSEDTRRAALPYLKERLGRDDVVALLEAVDDAGFERGSIGWHVDVLIHQSARREELLESVAFDANLQERLRVFAVHLLSYYVERRSVDECLVLLERFLAQNPDTDWTEELQGHVEMLRQGDRLWF